VAIESITMVGPLWANVKHSFVNDPLMAAYFTLVQVEPDHGSVKVGTPLACKQPLSHIELVSVVQIIINEIVIVGRVPMSTEEVKEDQCPRRWDTYEVMVGLG